MRGVTGSVFALPVVISENPLEMYNSETLSLGGYLMVANGSPLL